MGEAIVAERRIDDRLVERVTADSETKDGTIEVFAPDGSVVMYQRTWDLVAEVATITTFDGVEVSDPETWWVHDLNPAMPSNVTAPPVP